MKVLVTGAAGFLGSHLCDSLLNEGYSVVGVDNFFRGKKTNLPSHDNFKFYEIDLRDFESIKEMMINEEPQIVIHYAAINGTKYFYDIPYKVCNDNIKLTQNILNACTPSVEKIVYASSSEIYGPEPKVPTKESEYIVLDSLSDRDSYASSKAIGEYLVRLWSNENKRKYLIVRPFNTYGPRMATNGYGQVIPEFIERIKSGESFYLYGDGKQTRSFCYVTDHTDIMCKLIKNADNEILNIGFDEEITIFELSKVIHEIMGVNFNVSFKEAWKNDTKWRKPDLTELKKYIGNHDFTHLRDGVKRMFK
jgi:dTDP-glucose 4,6-dehydratase